MHDLIIVGGGPAGSAAAVYAARKNLKTIFITNEWGGQSAVSSEIQNWIGTPAINGADLADNLKKHVEAYRGEYLEIRSPALAKSLKTFDTHVEVTLGDGTSISALTLIVASGAERRKLEVAGAAEFDQKGLTYCASCDGPLFADMDVAVIGGGNAGFETAAQLLAYCKSVTLIHKNDEFKADPVTVRKVLTNPRMKAMLGTEILKVNGDKFVSGLVYQNKKSGGPRELPVQGIFVEIGSTPATDFLGSLVEFTPYKQIVVDPKNQRASVDGIWAAGDCTNGLYHQNNIAAGDAVKSLEDIYMYLHAK